MTNDIVTRLRACWCHDAFRDRGRVDPACDHDGVRAEAADEIERLRKDLMQWQWLADELYEYSDHKPNCTDGMLECICGYEEPMTTYLHMDKLSGRG